jgi:hypothetical protein
MPVEPTITLLSDGLTYLNDRSTSVRTDGSFTLEGVPSAERVDLRIERELNAKSASAAMPTIVRDVVVVGGPVSVRLRRGVFVEGVAVGPAGAVVSQGTIVADVRERAVGGAPVFVEGRLDAQGRFRIGPIDPGPVLLFYEGMMLPWASTRPSPVVAPARDVRVVVARAVTLRGRVLTSSDAAGVARWNPGAGNLSRCGTPIGADGTFALPAPADVPGLLYVAYADDRYALREGLIAGADILEVTLLPGQRIEGRLSGLPAADAPETSVVARRGELVLFGSTNPDGTFRIPSVPPGTYRVEIEYGDFKGGVDGVSAGATGVTIAATRR